MRDDLDDLTVLIDSYRCDHTITLFKADKFHVLRPFIFLREKIELSTIKDKFNTPISYLIWIKSKVLGMAYLLFLQPVEEINQKIFNRTCWMYVYKFVLNIMIISFWCALHIMLTHLKPTWSYIFLFMSNKANSVLSSSVWNWSLWFP